MVNNVQSDGEKVFWCGTPFWAVLMMMLLSLTLSISLFVAAWRFDQWTDDGSQWLQYFLYFLSAAFSFSLLFPSHWQRWTCFIATREGLELPSHIPLVKNSSWLKVPWSKVGEIKVAKFLGNRTGACIEILASEEELKRYFPGNRVNLPEILTRKSEYSVFGYSSIFFDKYRVVERLNQMKKNSAG